MAKDSETFFSQNNSSKMNTTTRNSNYKQQILHDVQMDTQTTFMNNGDINIFPCIWEQDKAPVTANGKGLVRYRAGVMVEEDGRTRMKRYRDGLNGPKYETLFRSYLPLQREQETTGSINPVRMSSMK